MKNCPACGGEVQQVYSAPQFQQMPQNTPYAQNYQNMQMQPGPQNAPYAQNGSNPSIQNPGQPVPQQYQGADAKTTLFNILAFICYAFAVIDFCGMFFHYDLTGVSWSPIVAGVIGGFFSSLGHKKEEN